MTPKEEARALVDSFATLHQCNECGGAGREIDAALICADKIIKLLPPEFKNRKPNDRTSDYWQAVKTEINKI